MDLVHFFQEHPKAALAFSGGVDSAYLLYAGLSLGAQIKAYYVKTAFQPEFELADALRLSRELGAPMEVLPEDILSCGEICANPADRCYHCKRRLFRRIQAAAHADGFELLLDGTNASDEAADRPGMQALAELAVRSPLREAGLTKERIRALSQEAGLFTWDKSAYACLATRIPTGEAITRQKLERTEWAEGLLTALGMKNFRIRLRGEDALLQVREEDLALLLEHRAELVRELKKEYRSVNLDLEVRNGF